MQSRQAHERQTWSSHSPLTWPHTDSKGCCLPSEPFGKPSTLAVLPSLVNGLPQKGVDGKKWSKRQVSQRTMCYVILPYRPRAEAILGSETGLRGRGRWKIHSSSFLLTISTEAWEPAMAEACFYSKKAEFGLRFCLGIKVRDISYIHIIIINQKSKHFIWFYNLPETSRVGIRQQCEDLQKSHYINFSPHWLEVKSMQRLVQAGGVEGHAPHLLREQQSQNWQLDSRQQGVLEPTKADTLHPGTERRPRWDDRRGAIVIKWAFFPTKLNGK